MILYPAQAQPLLLSNQFPREPHSICYERPVHVRHHQARAWSLLVLSVKISIRGWVMAGSEYHAGNTLIISRLLTYRIGSFDSKS